MTLAAGEIPDEPRIDGAEGQPAILCVGARTAYVVKDPGNFGCGEIGINDQPGLLADGVFRAILRQRAAEGRAATILPHDGVVDGFAGFAIPYDGGFALVGNSECDDVAGPHLRFAEHFDSRRELRRENVVGIMLDPAFVGIDLLEFMLRHAYDFAGMVEEDGARTGCALVERKYVGHRRL